MSIMETQRNHTWNYGLSKQIFQLPCRMMLRRTSKDMWFGLSSSCPGPKPKNHNEKRGGKTPPVRMPSAPTPPERPKARPRKDRGTDHRPFSIQSRTATFAGRSRILFPRKSLSLLTVGCRGYQSSTWVGSVAPLGNTKEDEYYRNDSMKYCRIQKKIRKNIIYEGGKSGREFIVLLDESVHDGKRDCVWETK